MASDIDSKESARRNIPEANVAGRLLRTMMLIRQFEERCGEQYMRAKIGGFLHLAIGEEATIVGTESAMRDTDYLLVTYRGHGQALARGVPPGAVMAELFGRADGCCRGKGGSMHLMSYKHRLLGGYGIVGGNLPIAAGVALAGAYLSTDDVTVCMFGDGASNQGTFGETMNLAALWNLPIVFVCVNNQYGMGTKVSRHSAVTDLSRKAECLGVPGERVDGMDVLAVRDCVGAHVAMARDERKPTLVEALTYRFRGHSVADPQVYRTQEEVGRWRAERDPVALFERQLLDAAVLTDEEVRAMREDVDREVEEAIEFADASPEPDPRALYEDVYALGDQVRGWYSLDERGAGPSRGELDAHEHLRPGNRDSRERDGAG